MTDAPVQENITNTEIQNNQTENKTQETEESYQDRNWRQFRETRAKERKEKELAEEKARQKAEEAEALKAALEAIVNKPLGNSSNQYTQSNDNDESEDERIQKKVNAALEAKQRQYEEEQRKKDQDELPQKLATTYRDFDTICSQENIDYLEFHHPEIAKLYSKQPESFEKWASVYNSIKKLIPNADSGKDKMKAEKNLNKPQSASVRGVTSTGDQSPQYLDQKKKDDNWKRMQKVVKGV